MKILVLEKNEEGKKIAENLFAERNDTIVDVLDAFDVPKLMTQKPYDIIFIPLKINGSDGTGLCQEIKKANPDCVVYAYSEHLKLYDMDTLESIGFDGFIKKPAKKETLITAIDGAIAKLQRMTFQDKKSIN